MVVTDGKVLRKYKGRTIVMINTDDCSDIDNIIVGIWGTSRTYLGIVACIKAIDESLNISKPQKCPYCNNQVYDTFEGGNPDGDWTCVNCTMFSARKYRQSMGSTNFMDWSPDFITEKV